MKLKNTKKYKISSYVSAQDEEFNTYEEWTTPTEFYANIYPATSKLQTELYGERINNIMNMLIDGCYNITSDGNKLTYHFRDFSISEGDGICVYGEDVDYKVISIKPYSHLQCEIERISTNG